MAQATVEAPERSIVECRRCGSRRHYFPSQLRTIKSYDPKTRTYLCRACHIRDLAPTAAAQREAGACADCGTPFVPRDADSKYCSPVCGYYGRAEWRIDSNPKARFVGQLRSRRISLGMAANEMAIAQSTLSSWLRRRAGRLRRRNVERLAGWLGISIDEALALQGGTSEDRRRPALQTHMKEVHARLDSSDPAWRMRLVRAAQAANKGRKRIITAERRAKISTSLKAAYRSGRARYKPTLRGRASSIMATLRLRHPDWSREDIEDETVRRLLGPRYQVGDERIARMLVRPCPPESSRGGRPAEIDYLQVHDWRLEKPPVKWERIGRRLGRNTDVVKAGYYRWLRRSQ